MDLVVLHASSSLTRGLLVVLGECLGFNTVDDIYILHYP